MDRKHILLAFRDEVEMKEFSAHLSGLGFEVASACDGARALELSIQDPPAMIVADFDLPVIGGERLFQILRNNPHTAKVPFLFISDGVADIKGFRTGVDIFLVKPVNLEEVSIRVRQSLSAAPQSMGSKELEGRLAHMPLADILQFLHLNRKEGELRLKSGESSGAVFVKDGQILNAVLDGIEKEKALFRLLAWTDGKFEFVPKAITAPRKIRGSAGNLLMEGMRQLDEFRKREPQFPSKDAVLRPRAGAETLPKGLQAVVYEIVQLAKSRGRVADIVERSSHPDYDVYAALQGLIARGVLVPEPAGASSRDEVFLTNDQMISIREKIISRFSDMGGLNYGRVLILATSGKLVQAFLSQCRRIPGLHVDAKSIFSQMDNPLGPVATLKLYGGLDLHLFSIPTVRNMGPLWRAFSSNLVSLVLLWDREGAESSLSDLASAKREILLRTRVPSAHVFIGAPADEARYKKELSLKSDEPLFSIEENGKAVAQDVFYSLFSNLLKDDYAAI
ncbi:MAG: DUF4388 domain-containing protein [Deltaproteobacteria bacterium]|nr:DUF4388 domain-containing protein [Deltaproteobacteria bacterium]